LKESAEPHPNPFYTINFACHRAFGGTDSFVFEFSGIKVSTIPSKSQGALYDLNFFLIERQTGWRLSLEYNTELYSDARASRMIGDFRNLLEAIASNPDRRISEFPPFVLPECAHRVGDTFPSAEARSDPRGGAVDTDEIVDTPGSVDAYELPASITQERFWLLAKIAPDRSSFNMPASVRIIGPLSSDRLEESLRILVERHEILRTTFKEADDGLLQHIEPAWNIPLTVSSLEDCDHDGREGQLQALLSEEARKTFDLVHGPLWRARLFRLRPDDHVLIVTLHHIISDGWSQGVLQRELWSTYDALEDGREPSSPPLAIQYADFTAWQNEWLASRQAGEHLDFWLRQLG
jgi:hypothetical protein